MTDRVTRDTTHCSGLTPFVHDVMKGSLVERGSATHSTAKAKIELTMARFGTELRCRATDGNLPTEDDGARKQRRWIRYWRGSWTIRKLSFKGYRLWYVAGLELAYGPVKPRTMCRTIETKKKNRSSKRVTSVPSQFANLFPSNTIIVCRAPVGPLLGRNRKLPCYNSTPNFRINRHESLSD